jgi:hypothetical protein
VRVRSFRPDDATAVREIFADGMREIVPVLQHNMCWACLRVRGMRVHAR